MDGDILGRYTSYLDAMALLFVVYYVFNIHYPQEAHCTLEFLQRWVYLTFSPFGDFHQHYENIKWESVVEKLGDWFTCKMFDKISMFISMFSLIGTKINNI